MRTIFKMIPFVALLAWVLPAAGQSPEASKNGFVRLANAISQGTGPLTMEIEGKNVNEEGYQLGELTGGISLPPGNRTVKFSRAGTKPGTTRVNVTANETTTLIPYAEKVPATDQEPAHWEIRILRLKQRDSEDERSATFVSVSREPEVKVEIRDPDGKWSPVFVKRLTISQAPIRYPRGYVPLKSANGDLKSIPVAASGNYVVLLYDDEKDQLQSLNFRDRKFLSAD